MKDLKQKEKTGPKLKEAKPSTLKTADKDTFEAFRQRDHAGSKWSPKRSGRSRAEDRWGPEPTEGTRPGESGKQPGTGSTGGRESMGNREEGCILFGESIRKTGSALPAENKRSLSGKCHRCITSAGRLCFPHYPRGNDTAESGLAKIPRENRAKYAASPASGRGSATGHTRRTARDLQL